MATNSRGLHKDRGRRSPVLKVNVQQSIIDAAQIANSGHCAGADALKDTYPQYTYVSIDLQTVRVSDPAKGLRYIYLTPRILQQAIWLFDQGKKIRPFRYVLRSAHVVAMSLANRTKGQPRRDQVRLGRRRLLANTKNQLPDVIGGRAPKKQTGPGNSFRREYGLRALNPHDLEVSNNTV